MNLAGKTFRAVANSENGRIDTDTEMTFSADDGVAIGTYRGGTIAIGHVIAKHIGDSEMEMLYQCVTTSGEVRAGRAHAILTVDDAQEIRMRLDWQWLTGDRTHGTSTWVLRHRGR